MPISSEGLLRVRASEGGHDGVGLRVFKDLRPCLVVRAVLLEKCYCIQAITHEVVKQGIR